MEGYQVTTMEQAAPLADIFVTATGCSDVVTGEHMMLMKDKAILCNIGHFDSEIQMACGITKTLWKNLLNHKSIIHLPNGRAILVLAGKASESGCYWTSFLCNVM